MILRSLPNPFRDFCATSVHLGFCRSEEVISRNLYSQPSLHDSLNSLRLQVV